MLSFVKHLPLQLIIVLIFLAGCREQVIDTIAQAAPMEESQTEHNLVKTVEAVTPEAQTLEPTSQEQRCGTSRLVSVNSVNLPGALVGYLSGEDTYKIINRDLSVSELELGDIYDLHVSPDGHWMSYWRTERTEEGGLKRLSLEFVSATGNQNFTVPWQENWLPPHSPWFSSDYIKFAERFDNGSGFESLISPTGNIIPLEWDNLPQVRGPNNDDLYPQFNPPLTHVLYRSQSNSVVLQDLTSEESLWESPDELHIDIFSITWAPDGAIAAFKAIPPTNQGTASYELYTLDIDGTLKRRTYFADDYPDFALDNFIWSPNSSYLLFAFGNRNAGSPFDYYPFLLERTSSNIIDLCIQAYTNFHTIQPWAPDSSALALVIERDGNEQLAIIDVRTGDIIIPPFDVCVAGECELPESSGLTNIIGWLSR